MSFSLNCDSSKHASYPVVLSRAIKFSAMSHRNVKLSQCEMNEKVDEFREWIKMQPDIPKNIDKMVLLRYLKTYGFRLDKAEKLLKYSLDLRNKNQQIFTNRDFLSPEIERVLKCCDFIPLLKATPENFKCCIMRLSDPDSNKFIFNDVIKTFFMDADVRLVTSDPDPEKLAEGEVPIFDMKGLSIWHILRVSLSTLRLYFKYAQEAHPVRVQQIHVYNCTPLLNRVMSLIKPLLKPEVAARFQFHTPGSDTIFNFFPRDMLPEDYGGTGEKIETTKEFWLKKFLEKRDYIMDDSNWIADRCDDLNNNNENDCK